MILDKYGKNIEPEKEKCPDNLFAMNWTGKLEQSPIPSFTKPNDPIKNEVQYIRDKRWWVK